MFKGKQRKTMGKAPSAWVEKKQVDKTKKETTKLRINFFSGLQTSLSDLILAQCCTLLLNEFISKYKNS